MHAPKHSRQLLPLHTERPVLPYACCEQLPDAGQGLGLERGRGTRSAVGKWGAPFKGEVLEAVLPTRREVRAPERAGAGCSASVIWLDNHWRPTGGVEAWRPHTVNAHAFDNRGREGPPRRRMAWMRCDRLRTCCVRYAPSGAGCSFMKCNTPIGLWGRSCIAQAGWLEEYGLQAKNKLHL